MKCDIVSFDYQGFGHSYDRYTKVNNNTLKVRFFTYLLNGIDNTDNITYKNYSRLLNFIEEVKEYISQNELYYTPEIKLEFKRDFDWEQEYNFINQIGKTVNLACNIVISFLINADLGLCQFLYQLYAFRQGRF